MQTRIGLDVIPSRLSAALAMVLGLATMAQADASNATHPPPPPFQVKSIRGYLYYQERGVFDDRDILTGRVALRNIITGEGDALTPSGAVLFLVDVEGPDFAKSVPLSASLSVEVRSEGRVVVNTRVQLKDLFSRSRRISVPVIAYGAFCSELHVVARLDSAKSGDAKTATAGFECGE
jgi:hypothetical protein